MAISETLEHKLRVLEVGEKTKLLKATDKIEQAANALVMVSKQFEGIDQDVMLKAMKNLSTMTTHDMANAVIDIYSDKK